MREFDLAEAAVSEAREALLEKGFSQPSPGHVLQFLLRNDGRNNDGGWNEQNEDPGGEQHIAGRVMRGCDGASPGPPSVFLASVALSLHGDGRSLWDKTDLRDGAVSAATGNGADAGAFGSEPKDAAAAAGSGEVSQRRELRGGDSEGLSGDGDEDDWFGAVGSDREAVGAWGFRDSGFCLESDRRDGRDPHVVMRGNRWVDCCLPLRHRWARILS